jgi:DNA-binding PadR family transcriptional regulator
MSEPTTTARISAAIQSDTFINGTEQLLTEDQVKHRYQLTDGGLRYLKKTRQIPFVRIGKRTVMFDANELARWERKRRNAEFGSTE